VEIFPHDRLLFLRPSGTRNLLVLFKVAIDPQNGKAAIIYTDDTITETSSGAPLPQVILAQQN
jgi:hypothetical protein